MLGPQRCMCLELVRDDTSRLPLRYVKCACLAAPLPAHNHPHPPPRRGRSSNAYHKVALAGLESREELAGLDRAAFEKAPPEVMEATLRHIRSRWGWWGPGSGGGGKGLGGLSRAGGAWPRAEPSPSRYVIRSCVRRVTWCADHEACPGACSPVIQIPVHRRGGVHWEQRHKRLLFGVWASLPFDSLRCQFAVY